MKLSVKDNPRSFRLKTATLQALQKIADKESSALVMVTLNRLVQIASDRLIEDYKQKGRKVLE